MSRRDGRDRRRQRAAAAAELWPPPTSDAVLVTRGAAGHDAGAEPRPAEAGPISVPAHSPSRCATSPGPATPWWRCSPCHGRGRHVVRRRDDWSPMLAAGRGGRPSGHRDRLAGGTRAPACSRPGSRAHEDKIVSDWSVLDHRLAEWHRHGPADRLHQRLLRPAASRPRHAAGRRQRRLRPADRRPQQRRLGAPPQGPERPVQNV